MELKNEKLPIDTFMDERNQVLAGWKTGRDPGLDFENAIDYLRHVPDHKHVAKQLASAKRRGVTTIQPRAGVPVLDDHITLLNYLYDAGADFLPSTIDSYTRQNRYLEAEKGLEESTSLKRALLNGFPAVNHGVPGCKKVTEEVRGPVQARHGTPDARLLSEIIHASGWTSNEGGGISYNIPYAKNVPLEVSLRHWQYCDRLVGFYQEQGITINREPFGPLTGTLVPPSISNLIMIVEGLLAAKQGVKDITLGYGMGGNIIQDIAAVRALREQAASYMETYGHGDVALTTVFHQWMGGFPEDEAKAMALIGYSSTVAALSKADKMITKSPHESIGIPTKEANGDGIKNSKFVVRMLKDQKIEESEKLNAEIHQIKTEVDCLFNQVMLVGRGDLAKGIVRAFDQGLIDVPFAPSSYNNGRILPARDNEGNIRILEFGELGFNREIKDFHRMKIEDRAKEEKREVSFQMTVDDVYSVSKGELIGRPEGFGGMI